jgi:hypothetical protein
MNKYRVFQLKRSPNYISICVLWSRQYDKFWFVLKTLQNSFTADAENGQHLLKDKCTPFSVPFVSLFSVSVSVLPTVCSILCFSSCKLSAKSK